MVSMNGHMWGRDTTQVSLEFSIVERLSWDVISPF